VNVLVAVCIRGAGGGGIAWMYRLQATAWAVAACALSQAVGMVQHFLGSEKFVQ
jgi:hypothetical protein